MEKINIPPEVQAGIAATVAKQAQEDAIGFQAAGSALPGPTRDVWSPVPEIPVGPELKVRRFVDGDFLLLDSLGHPLKSFQAMAQGGYKFPSTGPECWLLSWVMTRARKESKELAAQGLDKVKATAEAFFEEFSAGQLAEITAAILKQIEIYASMHRAYEEAKTEGSNGSPPSSSGPS